MSDTPQQRTDASDDEGLGTTPPAPQGRTDDDGHDPRDTDERGGLQTPVTREEVERRQLDDDVDTQD